MTKLLPILLLCGSFLGCELNADSAKVINLTETEKQQAMALLERRQNLTLQQGQIQAKYQADMNRANEASNTINLDSQSLCFSLRKAHHLNPSENYRLDEVNARLVKQ